jgi:beta-glucosidase
VEKNPFLERARQIVGSLSPAQKRALLTGKDFWHTHDTPEEGIEGVMMTDGPHGLRKQTESADFLGLTASVQTVCFPTAAGTACSFNRDMLRALGATLGQEAAHEDVCVVLGPAMNIKRSPLCGRNFEYFSEDPYLTGELALAYTQGMQSQGVGVCLKHFAVNNQETRRMTSESVVDERALREIYLSAFEKVVKKADPWAIMGSYNRITGGDYACESKRLLTEILREEWGFDGLVMSDWTAISDRVKAIAAGCDLEMPGTGEFHTKDICRALENGSLSQKDVDAACANVVALNMRAQAVRTQKPEKSDLNAVHLTALDFARESMVLLKNDGVLPLKKNAKVVFAGGFARKPLYQGGGSSRINSWHVVSAIEAVTFHDDVFVDYAEGFSAAQTTYDPEKGEAALSVIKNADVAVIFAGLTGAMVAEGTDRDGLDLPPAQTEFIRRAARVQKNLVVVLHGGSAIRMPWIDNVSAVLMCFLAGETVGEAQTDILFGDVNPSGKLAETFPLALRDTPCYPYFPGGVRTTEYRESIFVGYRYYASANKPVLFPFGHGLSYTSFTYSGLSLSRKAVTATTPLRVTFQLKNTGDRAGAEAAQIYVAPPQGDVFRPAIELKGFEKVFLYPGESKRVEIELDTRAFSYYHTAQKEWVLNPGSYEILVGASSADIRLRSTVSVRGKTPQSPYVLPLTHYKAADVQNIPDDEFEAVLGQKIPAAALNPDEKPDYNVTLREAAQGGSKIAKGILKVVDFAAPIVGKYVEDLGVDPSLAFVKEVPVRTVALGSGGVISREMAESAAQILGQRDTFNNAKTLLKGIAEIIRDKEEK